MRIGGLPPQLQQALLSALPRVDEGFRSGLADAGATSVTPGVLHPQAPPAPPATSVQMLVTLAAVDGPVERRRKLAVETERGLSMLERLHAELVAGVVAPERLQELLNWSRAFEPPEDPELAALASEVELRVRVELAKLDLLA